MSSENIGEGMRLEEENGKSGEWRVLSEREATGNCLVVSRVDSCPVLSDDGPQIQKEATSRLALSSCIRPVAPAPCG